MSPARPAIGPGIRERMGIGIVLGLVASLLAPLADDWPVMRRLELATLDWRMRWRGPLEPSGRVVIVAIDEDTLGSIGGWPPPRDVLARAIEVSAQAGAQVIALDLLLTQVPGEASSDAGSGAQTGPSPRGNAAEDARDGAARMVDGSAADRALVEAIAGAGNVVLPFAVLSEAASVDAEGLPAWIARSAYQAVTSSASSARQAISPAVLTPAPRFGEVAAAGGHVTLAIDVDGKVRSDLAALVLPQAAVPSLAIQTARLAQAGSGRAFVAHLGDTIEVGRNLVPVDERSRLIVNHYGPTGTIDTISLRRILEEPDAARGLSGRVVVLGATAPGASVRLATTYTGALPAVEHLATVIDNVLSDRVLRRGPAQRAIDGVAAFTLAVIAAWLAGRRHIYLTACTAGMLLASWIALTYVALVAWGMWIGLTLPSLAVVAAAALVETRRIVYDQSQRRRIERERLNLARYFPPTLVDRLADARGRRDLERVADIAVMFVDMVGSTRHCEKLPVRDAMALLREFQELIETAVFEFEGTVDKYTGDGALCCFGVVEPRETLCLDAMRAANGFLSSLQRWNEERAWCGLEPIRAGIGLHYGPALMGDMGGRRQFQFTVMGDTVNVASRLEKLTREQGTPLLVSDEVVTRARALDNRVVEELEALEPVMLRGRSQPISLWKRPGHGNSQAARREAPENPVPRAIGNGRASGQSSLRNSRVG